ncbi:MAG TPA: DUF3341 domain-containing protein [Bryobacteraceae bacterium]|nr:DUF3341 domain-containing protein [Bryobacteraceae bacterium]
MSGRPYGILAEFGGPSELLHAAEQLRGRRYSAMEVYTPYPMEEIEDIIPAKNSLPAMVFAGGLVGAITAWTMQTYIAIWDFPINVGGRPLYSWPSFIVILFELTVLFAAITAFAGCLSLASLPRPHHPVFNVDRFKAATQDGFFLCVEARDPLFDARRTREAIEELDPAGVWELQE